MSVADWPTRTAADAVVAQDLQLHPEGALYGVSVDDGANDSDDEGRPEIRRTRVYQMVRRWERRWQHRPDLFGHGRSS